MSDDELFEDVRQEKDTMSLLDSPRGSAGVSPIRHMPGIMESPADALEDDAYQAWSKSVYKIHTKYYFFYFTKFEKFDTTSGIRGRISMEIIDEQFQEANRLNCLILSVIETLNYTREHKI